MDRLRVRVAGRQLERGDLRLLVLSVLKRPMHGYQIMCQLRDHSHGDYMPSTGALYPQLRSLEEEGLIRCGDMGGKKTYGVTKRGEEYLKKNDKLVKQTMKRFTEFWGENDLGSIVSEINQIVGVLMSGTKTALESGKQEDIGKIEKSKEILRKTEKELRELWGR